jgi:hypothetical protein
VDWAADAVLEIIPAKRLLTTNNVDHLHKIPTSDLIILVNEIVG